MRSDLAVKCFSHISIKSAQVSKICSMVKHLSDPMHIGGSSPFNKKEWNEFAENKLHKVFPDLKECSVCPQTNRREKKTVIARLHTGHSFITHSFLLKGEECQCASDVMNVSQENIFYLIVQILFKQESNYSCHNMLFVF